MSILTSNHSNISTICNAKLQFIIAVKKLEKYLKKIKYLKNLFQILKTDIFL